MTLDFTKLTKTADPLELYPALGELTHWRELPGRLRQMAELRRFELVLAVLTPEHGDDPVELEPLYTFLPEADQVRRYMLLCYAPGSPLAQSTDMARRRAQALEKAGILKKESIRDGWQPFLSLTEGWAGQMLTEVLRLLASRVYASWLSDLMLQENLDAELRAPVEGLEDDKKGAAYERKLKISSAKPALHERMDGYESYLFGGDKETTEAGSAAALGQNKTDFTGGFAEKFAQNTK